MAFTKIDLPEVRERLPKAQAQLDVRAVPISGVYRRRHPELLEALSETLATAPRDGFKMEVPPEPKQPDFTVKRRRAASTASGPVVERLVQMTQMDNDEAVRHLQLRFKKMGLEEELKRLGAETGDTIAIKDFEFEFTQDEAVPHQSRRKKSVK